MATIDDCLRIQNQQSILAAPTDPSSSSTSSASTAGASHGPDLATTSSSASSTSSTLQIALQNNTTSANLYVNITGLAINNNNAVFMLESDGVTPYYPANPSGNQQPLQANVSIAVGGPGATKTVTVPQLAGARIWFSQDTPLTFLLNEGVNGPGLVEPSVTNTTDPNYALRWDFCEFTFNSAQLFANITYVDFVSIPVALELQSSDGSATQTVAGLPSNGLTTVCQALQQQQTVDCAGWDQLVVQVQSGSSAAQFLRALSPNSGLVMNSALFPNYFDPYVNQVWSQYQTETLSVDTQAGWGTVTGQVSASTGLLTFGSVGGFPKPSTGDIFSCSTGAFAGYSTNTDEMANLTARLAAAFNRSTLLAYPSQPDGATSPSADYYKTAVTNHYARILHATNLDGRGYAFPYDDVGPDGGVDQSGAVSSGSPSLFTVFIGGGNSNGPVSSSSTTTRAVATTSMRSAPIRLREMARPGRQLVGGRRSHYRRSVVPPPSIEEEDDEKTMTADMQQVVAPFLGADAADADEQLLLLSPQQQQNAAAVSDPEKMDLEKGLHVSDNTNLVSKADSAWSPSSLSSSGPDLTARLGLLLCQAFAYLWAAVVGLGRAAWALVPRPVAAPVAAACTRVAASPAVVAVTSTVSALVMSVATSAAASAVAAALLRPLVVRTALTAAVLLATYMAAMTGGGTSSASPVVASVMSAVTGWLDGVASGAPAALE